MLGWEAGSEATLGHWTPVAMGVVVKGDDIRCPTRGSMCIRLPLDIVNNAGEINAWHGSMGGIRLGIDRGASLSTYLQ